MNKSASQYFSRLLLLFLLVPLLLQSAPVYAQDCRTLVLDRINWIKAKPGQGEGSHAVGVKIAEVKMRETNPDKYPWGYGTYAEGRLGWAGDQLQGRLTTVFSDRKSSDGKHRFAPDKSDIRDITVFSDGRVRVVLVSWGNATYFLENVRCSQDGFITGTLRGNGVSLYSLALRKEVMHPESDGFRDWP
jgi:hypothetical protein